MKKEGRKTQRQHQMMHMFIVCSILSFSCFLGFLVYCFRRTKAATITLFAFWMDTWFD